MEESTISSLPLEIWMGIAEKIRSRTTLKAFAATCHAFHEISQTLLYTERKIHLHELNAKSLDVKSLPPGLKDTKDLKVILHEWPMLRTEVYATEYKLSDNEKYASFLTRLLSQMENLRSFQWYDHSFQDDYETALILSSPRLLGKLNNLPLLEHVSIQFAAGYLENHKKAFRCAIPLRGFRNLASLELYEFYGKMKVVVRHLAQALRESPNLKKLGLGMACDAVCEQYPEVYIHEREGIFFEQLCLQYASESNAQPLPLETLRLGNGVCLLKTKSKSVGNYLAKLVKVHGLKTLHVFNSMVSFDRYDESRDHFMEIDCSLLEDCKSLHQFSASRITLEIVQWLSGPARTVQELFVTDHYSMYDDDMDLFNLVEVNKLTTLYVCEFHVDRCATDDEWSSIASSDSDMMSKSGDSLADTINQSGTRTKEAVVFEGIAVITVLDRISRRNDLSQLEKLSLSFQFETQWTHFTELLPLLKNLEQLRIRKKSHNVGLFPPKMASIWPGITRTRLIALEYAKVIYKLCPSLRYICIGESAWHIQFCMPVNGNGTGLEFVPLIEEDMNQIEMFTYPSFADQSSLLFEDYHKDSDRLTDEEESIVELLPLQFQ